MNKKAVRRFAASVLALCLFCGILPLHAEDIHGVSYPRTFFLDGSEQDTISEYTDTEALREYLSKELYGFPERVDISQFSIPFSEFETLREFIWRELPDCFHVYGVGYYSGDPVPALFITYSMEPEEYYQKLEQCRGAAAELLDGIAGNDSLSDVEKALLIHDRLALHNEYDYTFADDSHTIYASLVKRNSVCDGYSKAYTYLLRLAGIECCICVSLDLNHSWNLVKIDGEYYHVDVTWDDPSWARNSRGVLGYVQHTNFLRSNAGIIGTGHEKDGKTDFYAPASGTKYDGWFWQNVNAAFQLADGSLYYIDGSSKELMRLNEDKITGTPLCSVSDKWAAGYSSYYKGNFSKLDRHGDLLFFNTSDTVYSYDIATGEVSAAFRPRLEEYESIYGMCYEDGYIVCDLNNCPSGDVRKLRQVRELYAYSDISAELSSAVGVSDTRTVTAEITSTTGMSGYCFGKSAAYTDNDIIASTDLSVDFTVTEPGTYYFTAFDGNGKPSETVSLTFCLVTLHPDGGELEYENIIMLKDEVIDLPSPVKEGFRFLGWSFFPDAETGITDLVVEDPPEFSEFYAVWQKIVTKRTAFGRIVSKAPVVIGLADAEGDILDRTEASDGEFEIEITDDTAFIVIYSEGYYPVIYLPEEFEDTQIDVALLLLGDVNDDGSRNNKDVTALFKYVSGSDITVNGTCADVNGDKNINNKDVTLLFRIVSGGDVELTLSPILMF